MKLLAVLNIRFVIVFTSAIFCMTAYAVPLKNLPWNSTVTFTNTDTGTIRTLTLGAQPAPKKRLSETAEQDSNGTTKEIEYDFLATWELSGDATNPDDVKYKRREDVSVLMPSPPSITPSTYTFNSRSHGFYEISALMLVARMLFDPEIKKIPPTFGRESLTGESVSIFIANTREFCWSFPGNNTEIQVNIAADFQRKAEFTFKFGLSDQKTRYELSWPTRKRPVFITKEIMSEDFIVPSIAGR